MERDPDRLPDADTPEGNLAALDLYFGITEADRAAADAILAALDDADDVDDPRQFVPVDDALEALAEAPPVSYEQLREDLDRHADPGA